MDLVSLMYKYINKFINSNELLEKLKEIDLSKYSNEEIEEINNLILEVERINKDIPNEFDEAEKIRIERIDRLLKDLENAKAANKETEEFINRKIIELKEDREIVRDGGALYEALFTLMTKNELVNKYASNMTDMELLEFITEYIHVPLPPEIDQEGFNDLVNIGIKEDKREALWRLAFNYNGKNKDFSLVEDYFILKRDDYYLVELISAVEEDLNMDKLIEKILLTKDKKFINNIVKRVLDMGITDIEKIKEIKENYQEIIDE